MKLSSSRAIRRRRRRELRRELNRILPIIVKKYRPERVILFGSLASGRIGEWSDLDLAIIKKTRKRFIDRLVEVALLARSYEAIDFLVYTPRELDLAKVEGNLFIQYEILEKGKILYAR